jgi:hypothetical protein
MLGFERLEKVVAHVEATPELKDLLLFTPRGTKAWEGLVKASASRNVDKDRKPALKEFFYCMLASEPTQVCFFCRVQHLVECFFAGISYDRLTLVSCNTITSSCFILLFGGSR